MDESCVDLYALEPQYHCGHGSVSYELQSHLSGDLHSRGNSNVDHQPGGFAARALHSRDGSDTAVLAFMIATQVSTIGPKSTRALLMAEILPRVVTGAARLKKESQRSKEGNDRRRRRRRRLSMPIYGRRRLDDVVCRCPYTIGHARRWNKTITSNYVDLRCHYVGLARGDVIT